jgi:hypothetical protein
LLKLAPILSVLLVVAAPAMALHLAPDAATLSTDDGKAVSWSLTYDHSTGLVTFTVDGIPSECTTPLGGCSQIFVHAYAPDGDAVGSGVLPEVFTVTGERSMSWSGKMPRHSGLAFEIEVGPMMPAYTFDDVTWGELKDLFNRRW